MKVGILKLGGNITWSRNVTTAGNVDVHTICRALSPQCEIHIISGKTRNTKIPKPGIFHDIRNVDINSLGLGALLVFNGNVNFFGGNESVEGIMNYVHINQFEGPVFIMNTDGQLSFKQIWPAIEPKPWSSNWKEEDVTITRKDIIYITQGRDLEKTRKEYEKQKGHITASKYIHFPIEKAILIKKPTALKSADGPKYDLIYGGKVRSTGRRKDLVNFYVKGTNNLKVHLFGGLSPKQLGIPNEIDHIKFGQKVPNTSFVSKMTQGMATAIIGDPFYHDNFFTLRMYEAMLAGTLLFIDEKMDTKQDFFLRDPFFDRFYVRNGKAIQSQLQSMSPSEIRAYAQCQYYDIIESFDAEEYSNQLISLIS